MGWLASRQAGGRQAGRQAGRQLSCSEDGAPGRAVSLFYLHCACSSLPFLPCPPRPRSLNHTLLLLLYHLFLSHPCAAHVPLRTSPFPFGYSFSTVLSLPLLTSSGSGESTKLARGVRQTSALVGLDPQNVLDAVARLLQFSIDRIQIVCPVFTRLENVSPR